MAKWGQPSDETFNKINDVLIKCGLENLIDTKIIINDDQTKVVTIKKESAASKFAYGYDLTMIINEVIYDKMTPKHQIQVIEEALAGTYYDFENDKLVVSTPEKVHRSFIDKYGWDEYEVLVESTKTLYEQKKNEGNIENE